MLKIYDLRCEYINNPIGIDEKEPRLSWKLETDVRSVIQSSYHIQVSDDENFQNLVWDSGEVLSDTSVHVQYKGEELKSQTRYYYRVMCKDNYGNTSPWSEVSWFEMGLMTSQAWIADWITPYSDEIDYKKAECPMLRKEFSLVGGVIASARLYATALGLYELHINGNRVGDKLLTPGWTSYKKRIQYQTYDVTDMLNAGKNAIGAVLANGWYRGIPSWDNNKVQYGDKLALLIQLHVRYINGIEKIFKTDTGWKTSKGPIISSSIYNGETYDARLESDWTDAGFDDSTWTEVYTLDHKKDTIVAQENEPVKVIQNIAIQNIFVTPKGETVADFGQNMVGWVKFKVHGARGTNIVLSHAEVLDRDGNFYIENLKRAKQQINYILKGTGIECFEPHFTYQGFRYVKIEGYPGELKVEDFTGRVIHSDMEQTGRFSCSDDTINKLQSNILWSQKGNFLDVPTDCPQRDERLGWTGDAQVFIRTACYNMNVASFFIKWLKDLAADQSTDGVPSVIPDVVSTKFSSSAAWGDAATICPWTLYLCYGDKKVLEQQYDSMQMWVEYIRGQGKNEFLWNTGFHYGDWLGLDAKSGSYRGSTPEDLIATAFYAYSTSLLIKAAGVLGKHDDVEEYTKLHTRIKQNFCDEFITKTGRLAAHTQTAHVLAMMFDLVEDKDRKRTINTLISYLEHNDYHMTTGFVGTPYLLFVLSENGFNDIAYKLLLKQDYPSWLYQISKGATTIWEHWDGIMEDGSFWSTEMNSFNHYAYGSVGEWLYRNVAGIDTDEKNPGYKHINIAPKPGPGLQYAKASFESMYGQIKSEWYNTEKGMRFVIVIPPNTTAVLTLPVQGDVKNLTVNGKTADSSEGVFEIISTSGGLLLSTGSGKYEIVFKNI